MPRQEAQPNFTLSQMSEILRRVFALTPSETHDLPSYDDQNLYVETGDGSKYVLKILNSEDSRDHRLVEVHTYAMSFLHQKGLPAQTAIPNTSGQLMSLEEMDCGYGPQNYIVRLLTYLPGVTISKVPYTPELLYGIAKTAASMDTLLNEMEHPHLDVLQRGDFIWSLSNVPLMEAYLSLLDGDPLQDMIKWVIHEYKTTVAPKYSDFRKCIIHGDFNDLNVLVQSDDSGVFRISGILDFGDMHNDYYVHELAIIIMYMMIEHPNPIEVGRPVLAGWESVLPLNEVEKECLYVLVMCRFCQSLLFARHFAALHPENVEYLMTTTKKGHSIFSQMMKLGKDQTEKVWFQRAACCRDGEVA